MKLFIVVLLVQGSAFAAIKRQSKACDERQTKRTEIQLLKDKLDHDPYADMEAIVDRLQVVAGEYQALATKCKR